MEIKNIKAALAYVASTSRYNTRVPRRPEDLVAGWSTPESAFAFALYERAVLDYFGRQCGNPITPSEVPTARMTATTGYIVKPNGKRVNILELLGIDAAWAWRQIETAAEHNNKMAA